MKKRPDGFLAEDKIDWKGEQFDYIVELHGYLWSFIRAVLPGASGNLSDLLDRALKTLTDDKAAEREEAVNVLGRLSKEAKVFLDSMSSRMEALPRGSILRNIWIPHLNRLHRLIGRANDVVDPPEYCDECGQEIK